MRLSRRQFTAGATAFAGASALALPALGQGVDFRGRTVEWLVPYGEGGGADTWARFLAPFFSRHLPGQPNVSVRNVPGGGSVIGANEFAARGRPDGTSLFGPSVSTFFPFLLNQSQVRYNLATMRPVLITPTGGVVYTHARMGVTSAADMGRLAERDLVYAAQAPTSVDLVPMLAFLALGLDVRFVFGMGGRGEGRLAFERGEATIDYQSTPAYLANVQPMVERGEVVPLFSWGILDGDGQVQRDPTFPDIPHFVEAAEMALGHPPSGVEFDAYMAFYAAGFAAPRPALLPAGTPEPIVQAYRAAVISALADPELQATGQAVMGEYPHVTGDATEAVLRTATSITPENQEWVRNHLRTTYNANL